MIKRLISLAAIGLIVLLTVGWLQNLHPIFDMVSTFRLHIFLVLVPFLIITLCFKTWKITLAGLGVSMISLYLTAPYLPGNQHTEIQPDFKVIQFNLRFNTPDTDAAIQVLSNHNPDVYLLQELTLRNFNVVQALKKRFPHQLHCTTSWSGSVAILSRHPFNQNFKSECDRSNGLAVAQIMFGGRPVTLATVHLKWPWPFDQHAQISRLENKLNNLPEPLVLAGDFNAAPWANAVQRVAKFTNAQPANGLLLTWRPKFVLPQVKTGLILPIDLIMVRGAKITNRKILADGSSDHVPVLSEIKLTE